MTKTEQQIQRAATNRIATQSTSNMPYLEKWAEQNRSTFEICMEKLAEELPQKYAELYVKILMAQPKTQQPATKTNIESMNVNINSKLDTISDIKDTSWRDNPSAYTQFEEVSK